MPHFSIRTVLIFVAKWALAGLVFALALVWIRPDLRSTPQVVAQPTSEPKKSAQIARTMPANIDSYADAVAKSTPAVVNIYTERVVAQRTRPPELDRFLNEFGPAYQQRVEASLGSGVIIDAQGHVVTNNHVIANYPQIRLQLADGRIANASVVGVDADTDLAVLKIKLEKIPVMTLGRSDKLRVGDVVLAIGNAFGLQQTVTHGIVSATGRDDLRLVSFESYIQTDAAINFGNSGGALVNTQGELIGINAVLLDPGTHAEGISFAIPVDMVRGVVEQILKYGHVRRGWLGVTSQDISPQRATELGLTDSVGVELTDVDNDSPASRAGLRAGDIIVAINGAPVHSVREATNRVAALAPGRQLHLAARRGNETLEFRLKVADQGGRARTN